MKKRPNGKRKKKAMRSEFDFSKPERFVGAGIVLLDPDVARAFPDAESVNRALRAIMEVAPRGRRTRSARAKS